MFNFAQKELYPQKHWLCNFLNSSCQHGQASFAAETRDAIITTSIISTSDRGLVLSVDLKISKKAIPFTGWTEQYSSEGAVGSGRAGELRPQDPPSQGALGSLLSPQHPQLGCREDRANPGPEC